jgi:hypothetical protein
MKSITPAGKSAILIGRKSSETVTLNISSEGELNFRPAVAGFIPIGSYAEFRKIHGSLTNSYKQEADLDLMNINWPGIGHPSVHASDWFTGVFDGGGKRISNLLVNPGTSFAGLFGASRGTIKNVCIDSGSLSGDQNVGSVVGTNDGFVIACSNAATITGGNTNAWAGGIVGQNYDGGTITASYNTGTVSGGLVNGGIAGINDGTITASYNTGTVSGSNKNGGVAGESYNATIAGCYNTGTVSGGTFGGVVGSASGTLSNNYTGTDVFTTNPPSTTIHAAWGIGTGGTNQYWKNYTGNAGKPQLWFE